MNANFGLSLFMDGFTADDTIVSCKSPAKLVHKTSDETTQEETRSDTLQGARLPSTPKGLVDERKSYKCKFCSRDFLNHRQLGGHVSKAH